LHSYIYHTITPMLLQ